MVATAAPFADSATGVGTVLSNALSASTTASRALDSDLDVRHTPTGQMFKLPFAMPKLEDIKKSAAGWEYAGQLELGAIGGDADERNAQFRTYQDIDNGAYVNNFNLELKQPAGGYFVDVSGGGAGRRDQYYGLQFGRANDWRVKIYFSEIPHVFTDRYKTLWNGLGTGNLTLLPGLTPGGTASTTADNAAVAATAAANPVTLALTRKRGGVRLDVDLSQTWKAYVSYALEKRQGARPLGSVWGNNGGTAPLEIAEAIDYDTTDLAAGLMHASALNAFNLRLSASLFHNNIDTLTFQEPYRIAPPAGITTVPAAGAYTQGRFDLTPNNKAYNARAEYTRKLPDFYKGFFTAVVSAGSWRQNDSLIPPTTTNNFSIANVSLLANGAWDTTGALSRRSLDGVIDTRLVDLTLSLNPTAALNVKLKARSFETDNQTDPYYSVNPNAVYVDADNATAGNQTRGLTLNGLTGVWGRLLNDASGQGALLLAANANPTGSIVIRNNIYSSKQYRLGPTADYRLTNTSNLTASAEREITQRTNRERARTWEDRYKLSYVNRGLGNSTLRTSYEYGARRGSRYITAYYEDTFSAALFPMPTAIGSNVTSWAVRNNSGLRNYELSDRNQHVVNARLDTMVRPNLDAGLSVQLRESRYPDAAFGRGKDSQDSANLDLNYQPSSKRNVYGFYSYQQGRIRQASINATANVVIGAVTALGTITPANAAEIGSAPGGPSYSLGNAWGAKSTDHNHVVGAGVKQDFGKASLNVDYSYSIGRTRIAYTYAVGGAINAANSVFAGDRMPDLATDVSYLDASLRFPLTDRLSARLVYRNQKESIRDWHYRNLEATPVVAPNPANAPTVVVLDSGPYDYRVNWFGVMLQIKL